MKFLQELKFKNIEQILWLDIETATIEKELTEESSFSELWQGKKRSVKSEDTNRTRERHSRRVVQRR